MSRYAWGALLFVLGHAGCFPDFHYGLGLRAMLTDWAAFRIEGRHALTDSFSSGMASNFSWTVGAEFFL